MAFMLRSVFERLVGTVVIVLVVVAGDGSARFLD